MSSRRGIQRIVRCAVLTGLILGSAAIPSAREFRTIEIESLRVTIDSDWPSRLAPGYLPVRFEITNMGDARVIDVVGLGSRMFRSVGRSATGGPRPAGQGTTEVIQTLRLRRGDHVKFTMSIPIFGDSESYRFEIREDGRTLDRLYYFGIQSGVPVSDAAVLFVADRSSPFGSIAPSQIRSISRISGPGGVIYMTPSMAAPTAGGSVATTMRMPPLDYSLEPARLPVSWTGYTSVRAVAIGKTEWGLLDDTQKAALVTWLACGGDLIFVDGQPSDLIPSLAGIAATNPDRTVARHFFGRVHALTTATLVATGIGDVLKAVDVSRNTAWALPANSGVDWNTIEARGFRLQIPGIEGIPARVYLAILVVFSVIIGPLSFWFLWRRQQRVLLVLTAPVISIVFIVVLTGYAVAGEGFGVHGRAATFTVLDEAAKQAVTRASISMYAAGLTPAAGLRFSRDTAVIPIGPAGNGVHDRIAVDLTENQRFSSGVLQARSPTNLEEVMFRPARERLTFTSTAGGMSVVNGLGATLIHLSYRDGENTYHLASPLGPGEKQTLTAGAIDLGKALPATKSLGVKFGRLVEAQPAGSYFAVLDRSPFWESGVTNLLERGSFHLVLGWPEGQRETAAKK